MLDERASKQGDRFLDGYAHELAGLLRRLGRLRPPFEDDLGPIQLDHAVVSSSPKWREALVERRVTLPPLTTTGALMMFARKDARGEARALDGERGGLAAVGRYGAKERPPRRWG